MKIEKVKLIYSELLRLSVKNWKIYSKLTHIKSKPSYKRKGYEIIKLSKKKYNYTSKNVFKYKILF